MIYAIVYFFLQNAKSFLGATAVLKFLPNLILLIGVISYINPGKGRIYLRKPSISSNTWIYFLFLALWMLSILRTARTGASVVGHFNDLGSIVLLTMIIWAHITSQFKRPQVFDKVFTEQTLYLLIIPSSVIALFLFFYAIGYNHPTARVMRMGEDMVILKALGFKLTKKSIPFAAMHPNLVGIWAGGTFILNAISIVVLKPSRRVKWLLYLNGAIIGVFLLFADSRGTLLATVVTAAVVYLTYKFRFAGVLRVFIVVVPFLPFLFIMLMSVLAQTGLADVFARRGGAKNLSTLSARSVIWEECMKEVRDPKVVHIYGWGEHGQSKAGVSARYAYIFPEEFYDDDLIVTHNMFFQAFFDVGYFGVLILMLALYTSMNNAIYLYNKGFRAGIVYIAFLVYFVLSGALESTFGNHFRSYTMVFLVVMAAGYAFRSEYDRIERGQYSY